MSRSESRRADGGHKTVDAPARKNRVIPVINNTIRNLALTVSDYLWVVVDRFHNVATELHGSCCRSYREFRERRTPLEQVLAQPVFGGYLDAAFVPERTVMPLTWPAVLL